MTQYDSALRRETLLAGEAPLEARRDFIKRTYAHLAAAILGFVGLEYLLIQSPVAPKMIELTLIRGGRLGWLLVLVAFMVVGTIADKWARSGRSPGMQYLGLSLYVVAEAFIFIPLLFLATHYARYDGLLTTAALITGIVFAGLTLFVFISKKDFSWMRGLLAAGSLVALGVLVASLLFNFNLGMIYCGALVLLASGYILFQTSNILHHYPVSSHVAASLALFSSVALLFFYVLRILMGSRR